MSDAGNAASAGGWAQLLRLILVLIVIAYPLAVYVGLEFLRPGMLGLGLTVLALARIYLMPSRAAQIAKIPLFAVAAYSLLVVISDSELVLRFYPVVINLTLAGVFAFTLRNPPPMIERISVARGMVVSGPGIRYVRVLTAVWVGYFVVGAAIAAATALFASWSIWALYNGFLSYLLIGLFLGVEVIYRRRYKARHAEQASP